MKYRVGHGYDIHRIVLGRPLVLGGFKFDTEYGLEGHSDADCLTHAICDALLGAAGLPDIGHFFPNTETRFRDISSQVLLRRVCDEVMKLGYDIMNVDATVVAEKPRIAPHLIEMKAVLAATMQMPTDEIGLKATTNEGVGEIGKGMAIAAHAVALIGRP